MDPHDIKSICPKLQKFIWEIHECRPGISPETIKMRNVKSGRNSAALCGRVSRNDRFSLLIPYCEKELMWDVIFLCDRPELPPDFYFHQNGFLDNVDHHFITDHIPSLARWDYNDPKALLNVLLEFLNVFKNYQLSSIPENHRAFMELGMLLENDELKNKVEVFREGDSIRSLVCVLPDALKSADDDFKLLLLLRCEVGSDSVRSKLQSYGQHKYWDADDNFDIPTLHRSDEKTVLLDLLPWVNEKIEKIITVKLRKLAKRKQLFFQFYITFKGSIVELDTINFTFLVLHLSKENFEFFLRIDLPSAFPDKPPQYKIISNYCFIDMFTHERLEYPITSVKYTPELSPLDIVKCFYVRFFEVFNNFRKNSIASLTRNLSNLEM